MYTLSAKREDIKRVWYVVDAAGQPLGRLAARVAKVLHGKHTPRYTRHVDTGDFVVVLNAGRVRLTGRKLEQKQWTRHSGIPGGFKSTSYADLVRTKPTFVIEKAVRGMLPKSSLGRAMLKKLKVYADDKHPHPPAQLQPLPA
jgi:large subunit ribosomal protein L13